MYYVRENVASVEIVFPDKLSSYSLQRCSYLVSGMVRRQAEVGPQRVRRRGGDLRPLRDHLAAGHHPVQQVRGRTKVFTVE